MIIQLTKADYPNVKTITGLLGGVRNASCHGSAYLIRLLLSSLFWSFYLSLAELLPFFFPSLLQILAFQNPIT